MTKQIKDLCPAPYNPRIITDKQLSMLKKSMQEFGDLSGIVVNVKTGNMVGGHQRAKHFDPSWKIVKEKHTDKVGTVAIGYAETPYGRWTYREVDWTEEKEAAGNIAANQHGGDFDMPKLKDIIITLDTGDLDMELLGFNSHELELMMTAIHSDEPADAEPQIDRAEELNKIWGVKMGDLFTIGDHRILCGDSTKAEDVARVMGGEKADVLFTDPPYGITLIPGKRGKVGGGTKEYPTTTFQAIQGDDKPFDPSPLLGIAPVTIIWGGNYFADKLPVSRCWFIWNKNHVTDRTFAGCELAWTNLDRHAKVFDCTWDGWTKQGESGSKVHPSQKPVKLCTDILAEVPGDIIADPFLGSGTSLIACENLKRRCFGIEISPAYVAVCLQRFEDAFGIKGTLVQDAFPGIEIKKIEKE